MASADIQYMTGVEEQMKRVITWREGGREGGGREREREREGKREREREGRREREREGEREGMIERKRGDAQRTEGLVKGRQDCKCTDPYLNMHEEDSSEQKKAKMHDIWNQSLSPSDKR